MVVGVVLAELLLALASVDSRLMPLIGLIALVAFGAVVVRWPLVGVAALIILGTSALPAKLVLIPAGPTQLRGYEVVLLVLFAVAALAPRRRTWGGGAGAAVAIFLVLLVVSAMAAVSAGRITMQDGFGWGRDFVFLLLFYVLIRLFPERAAMERVLVFAAIIAAITGIVSIMLATTHHLPGLFQMAGQGFAQEQQGITGDLNRVRLPGTALAYALLWFATLRVVRARGVARLGWLLVVAGMVANLALSFNRNMWVGTLLGLAALLLLGGVRVRRPFTIAGGVAALVVAGALLAGVGVSKSSPVEPIIQRGTTLFSPQAVAQENSLEDRGRETAQAWKVIRRHPLQGVGPGAPFGVQYSERQADGSYEPAVQLFLHNQYLYLMLIAGVPGLLAFLWFVGSILHRGVRLRSDPDGLAWTIGFAEILISAFVMIALSTEDMLTAVVLLAAAITVAVEPASRRGRSAPLARTRIGKSALR
jgi:O-antigen ligase